MKLVIIEGIGKKETVEKYLGSGYKVFATKGHVRDLPKHVLAVNVKDGFKPRYEIISDKKEIVNELKKQAAKADAVLLATDPDREGEAISWHVAHILNIPPESACRIEFNEISKRAIKNALDNPRPLDTGLIDAQQARRILDRLVGYKLSPVLCKKIQNRLSAGRVQSVTLRLIVEREREISGFIPEEYWPFASILSAKGENVTARLATKDGKKLKISSKAELDAVIKELNGSRYVVTDVKESVTKSNPPPPFITSTLQQDALNKLGMSLKQTSASAQALYEGVDIAGEGKTALITYIRTDSVRVADEAQSEAREFIKNIYGHNYVPVKPNKYFTKRGAQDAHEAIRPINVNITPDSLKSKLSPQHYKLYKLIYERFLASQMSQAEYNSTSVEIDASGYGFKVNAKTPLFEGYTAVYNSYSEEKDDDVAARLPKLVQGDALNFIEYKYEQKFTKPPARYTEASLVKAMEEKGIGRPATYTPTITLLSARAYTKKEGRSIVPTELGVKITDMLIRYFPDVMDVSFTARMEEDLDEIEEGGVVWQDVLQRFYTGFEDKIKSAVADGYTLKEPDKPTDYKCDKCGSVMVIKDGRFGRFLACSAYPDCTNTVHLDENGNIAQKPEVQVSDVSCPKCGAAMVIKNGRYGQFYACPNYPKCKSILPMDDGQKEDLPDCPKCGKALKKITTKKSTFYGCTGYPACDFTSSNKPTNEKCPDCGNILTTKSLKSGEVISCLSKDCKYKRQ